MSRRRTDSLPFWPSWENSKRRERGAAMKFLDDYRHPAAVARLRHPIREVTTRSWVLMEVCGGQTHSIVRHGIDELLPPQITLVHGPGCPVCVTPLEQID